MRKGKKEVPVVTRFTAFFDFALVDNTNQQQQRICRLEFEIISGEQCPKATENFRQLTSGGVTVGEKKSARQASYKGTRLLRCTPEMIQLGDTVPIASLLAASSSANPVVAGTSTTAAGGQQQSKPDNTSSARNQQAQAEKDAASAILLEGKSQDTIFGTLIEDEAFGVVPHRFGTLTLCNSGPNTNGSQFAIIVGGEALQSSTYQNNNNKNQNVIVVADGGAAAATDQNQNEVDPVTTNFSFLDNRHVSLGYLKSETNQFAKATSSQGEALSKLHAVASSLAVDKTGRLSATSGSYIVISDCGIISQ